MRSKPHRPYALFLAASLVWGTLAFSKEKEEIPAPPPVAKAATVTVTVGQPVEVSLQISGRIVEPLSFLVRKEPMHGKLSDLHRTGRSSATMLYTPDARTGAVDDCFSFAAQSADSPVSAPATVSIHLVERSPVLEHPSEIDFGKVFLGDKEERPLELRNTGGGVATGAIRLNSPWHAGKAKDYRVPAGTGYSIPLVFVPQEERDFLDRVQVGTDPESAVMVRGSGVAPVSWPKDGLVVSPADHEKGGSSITITNNSSSNRTLTVEWPDFLKAPKETTVPANGASVLQAEVTGGPQLNYQGEAAARSGNFQSRIPVRVFPALAKLVTVPDRLLTLGGNPKDGRQQGQFIVRNVGGSDSPIEIISPAEVRVTPDPHNLILRGGQEQVFEVQLENSKQDHWTIRIQSPACEPIELSVESTVAKPGIPSLPVSNFLAIPQNSGDSPKSERRVRGKVPAQENATVLSAEPHEIVLAWRPISPGAASFRIERRSIAPGAEGEVLVTWIPWQGALFSASEGMVIARLERLPANTFWTVHIVPLDRNGNPGAAGPAFQIATKPMNRPHLPWWIWGSILAAISAALASRWRKRRNSSRTEKDAQIARLENR
ncbi:MAG: hypothetical protein WCH98_15350 [Verrucomicrobiota bacterium]